MVVRTFFSKLTTLKDKLGNTIIKDKLNALYFLFVDLELTSAVFIYNIIDEFKILIPVERRLVL